MTERLLCICAHNDDHVIGAGGTIAKLAEQGAIVKVVCFSFGELSHPHLKPEVIAHRRIQESLAANKILGMKGIVYLGVKEHDFIKERDVVIKKLIRLIEEEKPTLVFTHACDDPHPEHRIVNSIVRELVKNRVISCDAYEFPVWNLSRLRQRNVPRLVIDITETFDVKIKSFAAHKSQLVTMWTLLWNVYLRSRLAGLKRGVTYAEVFYKI